MASATGSVEEMAGSRAGGRATAPIEPLAALRTAVVGVSGYAGGELARLLLQHPRLRATPPTFWGRTQEDAHELRSVEGLHPQLAGDARHAIHRFTWDALRDQGTELLLLATPHEQSRAFVPEALARGLRVIDLSGAWRLRDAEHRAVYAMTDADPARADLIEAEARYGCPELRQASQLADLRTASLVANPGCYATSILLALAPLTRAGLVDVERGIVADAKSGVSGAGKTATAKTHFMYAAENLSAYSPFKHRHVGELLEQLSLTRDQICFTPHLLPITRGILSSIYVRLRAATDAARIHAAFTDFYAGRRLVRVREPGDLPQIQHVVRTNFCDIGFALDEDGRRLLVVSCLDNLLKGAAGQAVQNLNLMCGWGETEGLL